MVDHLGLDRGQELAQLVLRDTWVGTDDGTDRGRACVPRAELSERWHLQHRRVVDFHQRQDDVFALVGVFLLAVRQRDEPLTAATFCHPRRVDGAF